MQINESTQEPKPKLPEIFPPKIEDLKKLTGKRANNKIKKEVMKAPIIPEALKKKNASKELIERIEN